MTTTDTKVDVTKEFEAELLTLCKQFRINLAGIEDLSTGFNNGLDKQVFNIISYGDIVFRMKKGVTISAKIDELIEKIRVANRETIDQR